MITRRELFGLAAGGAAAAVLPKAAEAGTMTPAEVDTALWQVEDIEIKSPENLRDVLPSEAPQILQATHDGDRSMTLTWARCSHTDHYEVHRDRVLIGTTREHTFTDCGLEIGRLYTYTITAIGLSGDHGIPSWPIGVGPVSIPPMKILPA